MAEEKKENAGQDVTVDPAQNAENAAEPEEKAREAEAPSEESAQAEPDAGASQAEPEADAPTQDAQGDDSKAQSDAGDKKQEKTSRFFGKKKDDKKDDKKDQQIADLQDQVRRQMAEFDNFRKRSEKEKSAMFEIGAKSILEKLLPIVDSFERGLAAVPEAEKESSTAIGMEKIYKQLVKALEEMEVKPIEAVGQEFSPDFHNAVMQAEEEGVDENIIVEEFQKGYLYRDSVLRHSMVKVNK